MGSQLPPEIREDLVEVLRKNANLFAWRLEDMKGITLEMDVHRLNIKPDAKLVKPKRRYFGEQQNEIIEKDGEKSLKIGHIERIQFPCWLDNTVLVPKLGNK